MGLKDQLLAASDRITGKVAAWGKDIDIMELSARQRLEMSSWFPVVDEEDEAPRARLSATQIAQVVAWGVVDSNGERVFSDDDVPALSEKSFSELQKVYSAVLSLTPSAEEAEGN